VYALTLHYTNENSAQTTLDIALKILKVQKSSLKNVTCFLGTLLFSACHVEELRKEIPTNFFVALRLPSVDQLFLQS
jgi:hypothetical protein